MAYLIGGSGNDNLNSVGFNAGMEMDFIYGDNGDDLMYSYGNDDILDGSSGNDSVYGGSGDDELQGGYGNDTLSDGSGNDWAYGGPGDDFLYADLGNDVYIGGSGIDIIDFSYFDLLGTGESNDEIPVVFDLAKATQNLGIYGIDQVSGFENVNGSLAGDILFGNGGSNTLSGETGSDRLDGRAGNDLLRGGLDGDVLIGERGADVIECFFSTINDFARDRIDYNSLLESGLLSSTRDVIFGFDKGGKATDDKIDLSTIDADPFLAGNQAFKFVNAFGAHVGEVKCMSSGGDTIVFVDADKDAGAEMTIKVEDVTGLTAVDFML